MSAAPNLDFLPWHRGYLFWFEQRSYKRRSTGLEGARRLGASLLELFARRFRARVLPQAFRDKARWKEAGCAWGETGVNEARRSSRAGTSTSALDLPRFEADDFRGAQADEAGHWLHSGTLRRARARAHGAVHVDIGRLMSISDGGARSIFWLHHANIDRAESGTKNHSHAG
jgi:hypothetical protein